MKKLLAIMLTLFLTLSLVACGGTGDNDKGNAEGGKEKILFFTAFYLSFPL